MNNDLQMCFQSGLAFIFAKFRALQLVPGNRHEHENSSAIQGKIKLIRIGGQTQLVPSYIRLDLLSIVPRTSELLFASSVQLTNAMGKNSLNVVCILP